MEEGSLRCDANISIRAAGSDELGTKTELKNMNSFRFIERGIEAEIARQRAIVEAGGEVEQETLHFDPANGSLTPLRSKEYAHDYRYFPEPDLVPLAPSSEDDRGRPRGAARAARRRRERYADELGLGADAAAQLAFDAELGAFFEARDGRRATGPSRRRVANWVTGELVAAGARGRRERSGRHGRDARGRRRARRARRGQADQPRRCREVLAVDWSARAASRPRSSRRMDLGAGDAGELEAVVERAIEPAARRGREGQGGGGEGDRRARRRGDAGDAGQGRRRRGHAADPREARALGSSGQNACCARFSNSFRCCAARHPLVARATL